MLGVYCWGSMLKGLAALLAITIKPRSWGINIGSQGRQPEINSGREGGSGAPAAWIIVLLLGDLIFGCAVLWWKSRARQARRTK